MQTAKNHLVLAKEVLEYTMTTKLQPTRAWTKRSSQNLIITSYSDCPFIQEVITNKIH